MDGWVKLHRTILEWQWFNKPEIVSIFIFLILKANHADNFWQNECIKRGQLITSPEKISNATGVSYQSTRTILKKLENSNEIIRKSTNKYTIITICNYEHYQSEEQTTNKQLTNNQQTTNKQLTNNQQTTNKQLTTNKNEKNNKNIRIDIESALSFYENEISVLNGHERAKDYRLLKDYLFGKNALNEPLRNVLSLPKQLSFDQFLKVLEKKPENKRLGDNYLMQMENTDKYTKNRKSLYAILIKWFELDSKN